MADDAPSSLTSLIERLRVLLSQPLDFAATDTAGTLIKVRLLVAAATYFNVLSVSDFGGRSGPVREEGLVENAIGAAFQTFGGYDPHPDPFDKAAMLLRGITQGHPFNDGNKRTGFLVAAYYLRRVGIPVPNPLHEDAVVNLCMRVSAGDLRDIDAIAQELRHLWEGGRRDQ
ncbi:MAG: type II toxin-antitoxin system death-on-curing family toxin [Dehalococcoidia bacterium]